MTVEREADGTAVVVKRALGTEGANRLAGEATWLRELGSGGGLVELVRHDPGPPATLVTAYAGDRTLAHRPRPSPDRVVKVGAAICDSVAALHAAGVVHGRLTPDHVILGPEGRVVLCGMAEAGPEADGRTKADDVRSVGLLLRTLFDGDLEAEPIPDRRPVPWRTDRWSGYLRRALLTLADQATADVPERRPSAAHLAAALRTTVPTRSDRRARPRRRQLVVGAAVLAVLPIAAFMTTASRRPGPPVVAAAPARTQPTPSTTTSPTSTMTALAPTPSTTQGSAVPPVSMPPIVAVGPGRIAVDGITYRVGEPSDRVATGDWDCDGVATLALLRPATGEVFGFPDWDPTGTGTTGVYLGRQPGAVDLADASPTTCRGVPVELGDGRVVEVEAP